jgi:hypothetical protein
MPLGSRLTHQEGQQCENAAEFRQRSHTLGIKDRNGELSIA